MRFFAASGHSTGRGVSGTAGALSSYFCLYPSFILSKASPVAIKTSHGYVFDQEGERTAADRIASRRPLSTGFGRNARIERRALIASIAFIGNSSFESIWNKAILKKISVKIKYVNLIG
jgi:hypothetical protein